MANTRHARTTGRNSTSSSAAAMGNAQNPFREYGLDHLHQDTTLVAQNHSTNCRLDEFQWNSYMFARSVAEIEN